MSPRVGIRIGNLIVTVTEEDGKSLSVAVTNLVTSTDDLRSDILLRYSSAGEISCALSKLHLYLFCPSI